MSHMIGQVVSQSANKTMLEKKISDVTNAWIEHLEKVVTVPLCLTYTMGKVGSSAIHKSLKMSNIPTLHLHTMRNDLIDKAVRDEGIKPAISASIVAQKLVKYLSDNKQIERVKVITLVRRPDERNLSAFFQNASKYGITPNTDEKEAFRIFIEKYHHHIPNRWFDDEIKKYLGLDVYKEKFCRESKFIGGQGMPLLLLESSLSNNIKTDLLSQFLGVKVSELQFENVASDKPIAKLYGATKRLLRTDQNYKTQMENTKYFNHFYA